MNVDKEYFDLRIRKILERLDIIESRLYLNQQKDIASQIKRGLNKLETSRALGISERTLERACTEKKIKSFLRHNKKYFRIEDIIEYAKNNEHEQE
ncbi:MAG: hypothetical protein R3Y04_08475 [Rikenellaceae bacterium]